MAHPEHDEKVQCSLKRIDAERTGILKLAQKVIGESGPNIYQLDFLILGTIKRYLSTASGFRLMIDSWNIICARSLLRIHIDTLLRFSAAWLVEDAEEFASLVLKGTPIKRLKDRTGNNLLDSYLVQKMAVKHPWLPNVYKNLSGYVHFSSSHIFASIATVNDADRTVHFSITDADYKFPAASWLELTNCFSDTSNTLCKYLVGYAETKRLMAEASKAKGRNTSSGDSI